MWSGLAGLYSARRMSFAAYLVKQMEVFQQDVHGKAGSRSRYLAAARPAIYFASSTYF
jgi:hypothetical protein